MRLLRRSNAAADSAETEPAVEDVVPAGGARNHTPGKGRPTPSRKQAQKVRTGPVPPPPQTRREAYRRQKELGTARRTEGRERVRSGEARALGRRDAGPERALVRDVIDSRRNAGGAFLFVALFVLLSYAIPSARFKQIAVLIWMATFLLMIFDSILVGLRIRKLVRERFPDTRERTGSLILYGINRSIMIRRWRLPGARVGVGDAI